MMMSKDDGNGRERLIQLMNSVLSGNDTVQAFCETYENVYNFDVDLAALSPKDAKIFSTLFDQVTRYSPYPDERKEISFYLGEKEVIDAVRDANSQLT